VSLRTSVVNSCNIFYMNTLLVLATLRFQCKVLLNSKIVVTCFKQQDEKLSARLIKDPHFLDYVNQKIFSQMAKPNENSTNQTF